MRRNRFSAYLAVFATVLALLVSACGGAQGTPAAGTAAPAAATPTPQPEKVRIAYTSTDATQGPLFNAIDLGLFKKYGIDAEVSFIDGGTNAMRALVAGQIDMVSTAGSAPISASLAGSDVKIFMGALNKISGTLYASKDVKTPADLKGKKAAVSSFGSETDFAVRYSLRKLGLEPDKDIAVLQVGNQTARYAAIQAGQANVSTALPPLTRQMKAAGYTVLGELPDLIPEAQSVAFAASAAYLKTHASAVRGVAQAWAEGLQIFRKDSARSKPILGKYLKITDDAALQESIDYYGPILSTTPLPTLPGIKLLLTDFITDPKAKTANPADFVDSSAVQALQKEGVFDKIAK